jgi:pimeloyl-ACP methyl ester carboxylesterase
MNLIAWIVGIGAALVIVVAGGLVLFSAWTARQVEQQLPPRGRFIEIDGSRIHYLDEGTGLTLLLIHGLAGQMHNFTHSLFDRLKTDHRVVVLDRPGSGYSTRPAGASAALAAQADTIARFCRALELERPLVVGHSMGGAIALALALNHPDEVAGLALIAPVTHQPRLVPLPFKGLEISSPLIRRVVGWTLATPVSMANRELVLATLFGPQLVAADFATKGGALLNLRPSSFIGASDDLNSAHADLAEMPERYKSLTLPVGILYGSDDRILDPVVHGKGLAEKLADADLELIEGGGHMILIASADRSAAFIARMAQRVAAADATLAPVA